jgi:hypothetical protein
MGLFSKWYFLNFYKVNLVKIMFFLRLFYAFF